MKAGIASGVAAALLLLTWLLLSGFAVDERPFNTAMQLLDELELAEAAIRRDLLSARAGLLRDYDPLVGAGRQVETAVARLRAFTTPEQADRLEAWRARQEMLVEASKSDNALLRNSLAQLGRLTVRLSAPPGGGAPVAEAGRLGSTILHLTLDSSAQVLAEVRSALAGLRLQALPESERGPAAALLAHGSLLQDLLPRVDGLLRDLLSHASGPAREAIAAEVQLRREAAEGSARRYRLLLYASAVLLLGALRLLGLRLRARVLAMRRHAAFEHMLARLSARLIGTGLSEVEAGASHALEKIAQRLGAQRAYLAIASQAPSAHIPTGYIWASDGATPPDGWPGAVLALADRHTSSPRGTLRLPPGHPDLRDFHGGLHAWMAAVRRTEDGLAAVLGCDLTHPGHLPSEQELDSLGLALDAILNLVTRSRLEAERARLAAQDARSRQMEMLGTFASGIAHNVNNIIGAILGFTEMAQAEPSGARLADIRRAAERARDLASDILAFGGRQSPPQGEVEVEALLVETQALLRAMLPPEVRLKVRIPVEGAMISGDATRIQQVIVNLCRNAAQAMDGPGEVVIEVDARASCERRALRLGELRPDHYLIIRVSDTGMGMDATTLGHIFEPFFTTRGAGHGLGLATVGEIVLAHGGGIEVRSTLWRGSSFEVWLPRAIAAEAARREMPRGEGEAVLLLYDDGRLQREEELLAALGYEPHGFRVVTSALTALQAAPRRFEAALLPEGSAEAVRKLRRVAPALPIILAVTTPVAGFDCIAWPIAADELATALRRCLTRRTLPA
jgi:signal transduction histidine kinase